MSPTERATRAMLHGLAAGASLVDALRSGAMAAEDGRVWDAFRTAAEDLQSDAFRRDVLARLGLRPQVVTVLLSRAPKDALAEVARCALAAIDRRSRWRLPLDRLYLLGLGLVTAAVATTVLIYIRPVFEEVTPGSWEGTAILVAPGMALLAALAAAAGLLRAIFGADLGVRPVLLWLAAAEVAAVPPGAVLEALRPSASGADRRRITRWAQLARGAGSARDAVAAWAEQGALRGDVARLAGLVGEDEAAPQAITRMARIEALAPGPRFGDWDLALGAALNVLAVGGVAWAVISWVSRLARLW
jgi:hypothetical protein